MNKKYIFVTGGVVSGLGKGITAASLGRLLKSRGLKVAAQKFDPYINIDPGTMSPFQHGEVFVTDDGAETDLDLGHYERFIDENLNKYSNITTGKVYWNVLNKERKGEYLGDTVQVIPHITNEIKNQVYSLGEVTNSDIIITEIGGTVGDIESTPFLEAIRQVSLEVGRENCLFIHVTLVPYIQGSEELKSKPTQHSVKELQGLGIKPDMIICRCDIPLTKDVKNKIALFCNVKQDCVIENSTVPVLYEAPLMLEKSNFSEIVCRELGITGTECKIDEWVALVDKIKKAQDKEVKIGIIGKYVQLHDAYISVVESLKHAGYENGVNVTIEWIDSEDITRSTVEGLLKNCQGIVVPGGFGNRGVEGKIEAVRFARENDLPFLGICLGMQVAVIEYGRNVLGLKNANSREFDELAENPVIDLMSNQVGVQSKGGTMRLGSYPCKVDKNSKLYELYGEELIHERHRHRFEFNNDYREQYIANGLKLSGISPDGRLVEAVELDSNKFFVAAQYHPEFLSRPNRPHPLFVGLVKAAKGDENVKDQ
ncbi:CTP synthase [uncultured Clostridium sp.]|uniref:CTP synthase n=1 Tax=uncultured Clostridium sp. TaxID=59620 RepID=UPI0025D1CBC1|nr:CTP synthase [uncultured Clostridium sp.]